MIKEATPAACLCTFVHEHAAKYKYFYVKRIMIVKIHVYMAVLMTLLYFPVLNC